MNQIDHTAKMAAQDLAFPDYDERGWPSQLVCAVNELREHAARVMEIAAALRTTNALRAGSLHAIANSLEFAAAPAERYMQENAGPGRCMQAAQASSPPSFTIDEIADAVKRVNLPAVHAEHLADMLGLMRRENRA